MQRTIEGYRSLIVWQKADELAFQVYIATKEFPKSELFALVSQMRRSAVSVPANIVEGYARQSKKEKLQFCYIARGSLAELEYYIDLSLRLDYLKEADYKFLQGLRAEIARLLTGYIHSLKV